MWDTRLAIAWRLLLTLTHAVMNFFFYVSLNEKETQVGLSITIIAVHSIEIDLKLAALLHNEWNERVGNQDGGTN